MSPENNSNTRTFVVLFIGILAVSSASIFIRFAQKEVNSLVIATYRLTLAVIILTPFCLKSFKREVLPLKWQTKGLLLLSGFFLACHFALWISSLAHTSVASSVVLVATTPIWVAILSPVFLKERSSKWVVLGLTIAMIGSVLVGLSSGCAFWKLNNECSILNSFSDKGNLIGNLMALGGAFFSCGYLIVGRKVREVISFHSYIYSVYGTAAVVLILMSLVTCSPLINFPPINLVWLVALAVFPQIIGHSSFNWALKYLPASYVSIALLGEPVGSVLLAMAILGESPVLLEIIGGLLILTGILVATRTQKT
jgi:drug/metabolite transporter (DMT)-like permease